MKDDPRWHPAARFFPLMSEPELKDLAEDIGANGQQNPVTMLDELVLDGRNRVLACEMIGREPVTVEAPEDARSSPVRWVISRNLKRRHLTPSQAAAVAVSALPSLEAEARERMREGGRRKGRQTSASPPDERKSAALVATQLGTNRNYVAKAKRISKEDSRLLEEVRRGELTIPQAIRKLPRAKREVVQGARVKHPARYRTIVIDPWGPSQLRRNGQERHELSHPIMIEGKLRDMPVPTWAEENCHLYLRTPHQYLPAALQLVDAWGFQYECLLTWVKEAGIAHGPWLYSTEHIVFARRGNLAVQATGQRTDFRAGADERAHMPETFYDLVRKVSPESRLEVFGREAHDGFEQGDPKAA